MCGCSGVCRLSFLPLSCSSATIRLPIAQLQLLGDYEPSSSCLNSEADLAKGAVVTAEGEREEPGRCQYHFNTSMCQGIVGCSSTTVVLELADLIATPPGLGLPGVIL